MEVLVFWSILIFAGVVISIMSRNGETENDFREKLKFIDENITKLTLTELAKKIKSIYEKHYKDLSNFWVDFYKDIIPKIDKHKDILLKKRRNKTYTDEYDIKHNDEWIEDLNYFIDNVIFPSLDMSSSTILPISIQIFVLLELRLHDVNKYIEYRGGKSVEISKTPYGFLEYYCNEINFNLEENLHPEKLFLPEFDKIKNNNKKGEKATANFKIKMCKNESILQDIHSLEENILMNYIEEDDDNNDDEEEIERGYEYSLCVIRKALHFTIEYMLDIYDIIDDYNYTQQKKVLSPIDFENDICLKLKQLGFRAKTTKASGDQGVDVIAEKNDIKFAVQCKLYSSPVGNKAVQEVCAGRDFYDADYGVVVTNNNYTPAAKKLADKNGIILLNDNDLEKLLKYCE